MVSYLPVGRSNVTASNSTGIIYVIGDNDAPESWRFRVVAPDKMIVDHLEVLIEANITLTEAKVISIEAGGFTSDNPFFGSVLIDSRADKNLPAAIAGDMTGRVVEFDGFVWGSSPDGWFAKSSFEHSFFSDRGIFQRMNIVASDPNNRTNFPPVPDQGFVLGALNTDPQGNGVEILSVTTQQTVFGSFPIMVYGASAIPDVTADQLDSLLFDGTAVAHPYEGLHIARFYNKDDYIVQKGWTYVCNTDGVQTGNFAVEKSKWDPVLLWPNYDRTLIDRKGVPISDRKGNLVLSGGPHDVVS